MKCSLIVGAIASLASVSVAAPSSSSSNQCLCTDSAQYLVNGFASLLTAFSNTTANTILADDFTDTSDSINWLAGYPLGSTTFPSKAAFIAGQGTQQPIGFNVLAIEAVTCDTIAFRWAASLGGSLSPIKGINILKAENKGGKKSTWQIKTVFSEFNSGLWKQELCQIGAIPAAGCSLLPPS